MTARVAELLPAAAQDLRRYVKRHAGRLVASETADDLVQGILERALRQGAGCSFRARELFLAWLYKVAASHLADRHAYWAAQCRRPERLLRLTRQGSATTDPRAAREQVRVTAGPGTKAGIEEDARRAGRALQLLRPRDRELVESVLADASLDETAARLGVSYTAARQARLRALERLRTTFAALERAGA